MKHVALQEQVEKNGGGIGGVGKEYRTLLEKYKKTLDRSRTTTVLPLHGLGNTVHVTNPQRVFFVDVLLATRTRMASRKA